MACACRVPANIQTPAGSDPAASRWRGAVIFEFCSLIFVVWFLSFALWVLTALKQTASGFVRPFFQAGPDSSVLFALGAGLGGGRRSAMPGVARFRPVSAPCAARSPCRRMRALRRGRGVRPRPRSSPGGRIRPGPARPRHCAARFSPEGACQGASRIAPRGR